MAKKYVYFFGAGKAEGSSKMRNLLGGKGCDLAEMTNLKIPVPPGFTITTEVCNIYYDNQKEVPAGPEGTGPAGPWPRWKRPWGRSSATPKNPLLLSVRSGARVSMPGMMDTILNLGLNDQTVQGLIEKSGDERFAYDSYRRFVQMYSDVVLGVGREKMEERIAERKNQKGVKLDTRAFGRRLERPRRGVQGNREAVKRARISPRTRRNSSGAPSGRSSNPGTLPGRSPTAS